MRDPLSYIRGLRRLDAIMREQRAEDANEDLDTTIGEAITMTEIGLKGIRGMVAQGRKSGDPVERRRSLLNAKRLTDLALASVDGLLALDR